jgi:hypothetical protein
MTRGELEIPMRSSTWKLQGRDTFAGEEYALDGEFDSEDAAIAAAKACLDELDRSQPIASSGGQDGIQDHVYVVRPDGTRFRVRP